MSCAKLAKFSKGAEVASRMGTAWCKALCVNAEELFIRNSSLFATNANDILSETAKHRLMKCFNCFARMGDLEGSRMHHVQKDPF